MVMDFSSNWHDPRCFIHSLSKTVRAAPRAGQPRRERGSHPSTITGIPDDWKDSPGDRKSLPGAPKSPRARSRTTPLPSSGLWGVAEAFGGSKTGSGTPQVTPGPENWISGRPRSRQARQIGFQRSRGDFERARLDLQRTREDFEQTGLDLQRAQGDLERAGLEFEAADETSCALDCVSKRSGRLRALQIGILGVRGDFEPLGLEI